MRKGMPLHTVRQRISEFSPQSSRTKRVPLNLPSSLMRDPARRPATSKLQRDIGETSLPTLGGSEVPTRPVALGLEFDESGRAGANCAENDRSVGIGHDLGLNAVGAVDQLINLPKLLRRTCVGGHRDYLAV